MKWSGVKACRVWLPGWGPPGWTHTYTDTGWEVLFSGSLSEAYRKYVVPIRITCSRLITIFALQTHCGKKGIIILTCLGPFRQMHFRTLFDVMFGLILLRGHFCVARKYLLLVRYTLGWMGQEKVSVEVSNDHLTLNSESECSSVCM